jgi:hydrogenase maturation protease
VKSTLIVAFGNPLRSDDGVGPAVVEALRQRTLAAHVEVLDAGTAGLEAALLFEGRSQIIVIDAADLGQPPGTVRKLVLAAHEMGSGPVHPNSLHAAGLREALGLAAALGVLPDHITLFAVQPQSLQYRTGLSAKVQDVIPGLVESIVASLDE